MEHCILDLPTFVDLAFTQTVSDNLKQQLLHAALHILINRSNLSNCLIKIADVDKMAQISEALKDCDNDPLSVEEFEVKHNKLVAVCACGTVDDDRKISIVKGVSFKTDPNDQNSSVYGQLLKLDSVMLTACKILWERLAAVEVNFNDLKNEIDCIRSDLAIRKAILSNPTNICPNSLAPKKFRSFDDHMIPEQPLNLSCSRENQFPCESIELKNVVCKQIWESGSGSIRSYHCKNTNSLDGSHEHNPSENQSNRNLEYTYKGKIMSHYSRSSSQMKINISTEHGNNGGAEIEIKPDNDSLLKSSVAKVIKSYVNKLHNEKVKKKLYLMKHKRVKLELVMSESSKHLKAINLMGPKKKKNCDYTVKETTYCKNKYMGDLVDIHKNCSTLDTVPDFQKSIMENESPSKLSIEGNHNLLTKNMSRIRAGSAEIMAERVQSSKRFPSPVNDLDNNNPQTTDSDMRQEIPASMILPCQDNDDRERVTSWRNANNEKNQEKPCYYNIYRGSDKCNCKKTPPDWKLNVTQLSVGKPEYSGPKRSKKFKSVKTIDKLGRAQNIPIPDDGKINLAVTNGMINYDDPHEAVIAPAKDFKIQISRNDLDQMKFIENNKSNIIKYSTNGLDSIPKTDPDKIHINIIKAGVLKN